MIKKYILCIFAVLITITNSSYAFPAYSKPMSKRATLAIVSEKFNTPPVGKTDSVGVDDVNNFGPVGKLDIKKSDGSPDCCTAALIKTDNGNIAITAAHCLFNFNTQTWNSEVYFYPGFNKGQQGKAGKVAAIGGYIVGDYAKNPLISDYGFIKLDYQGKKLQNDAGALDYDLDISHDSIPVSVFGYPTNGDMNCPKDGQTLCEFDGPTSDPPSDAVPDPKLYRAVKLDVGECSDGGPWIRNYNSGSNTGNVMGVSSSALPDPYSDETIAWSWTSDEFSQLLAYAQQN